MRPLMTLCFTFLLMGLSSHMIQASATMDADSTGLPQLITSSDRETWKSWSAKEREEFIKAWGGNTLPLSADSRFHCGEFLYTRGCFDSALKVYPDISGSELDYSRRAEIAMHRAMIGFIRETRPDAVRDLDSLIKEAVRGKVQEATFKSHTEPSKAMEFLLGLVIAREWWDNSSDDDRKLRKRGPEHEALKHLYLSLGDSAAAYVDDMVLGSWEWKEKVAGIIEKQRECLKPPDIGFFAQLFKDRVIDRSEKKLTAEHVLSIPALSSLEINDPASLNQYRPFFYMAKMIAPMPCVEIALKAVLLATREGDEKMLADPVIENARSKPEWRDKESLAFLGRILQEKGDYGRAVTLFTLSSCEEYRNKCQMAALKRAAEVRKYKQYEEAVRILEECIDASDKSKDKKIVHDMSMLMASIANKERANPLEAVKWYGKAGEMDENDWEIPFMLVQLNYRLFLREKEIEQRNAHREEALKAGADFKRLIEQNGCRNSDCIPDAKERVEEIMRYLGSQKGGGYEH